MPEVVLDEVTRQPGVEVKEFGFVYRADDNEDLCLIVMAYLVNSGRYLPPGEATLTLYDAFANPIRTYHMTGVRAFCTGMDLQTGRGDSADWEYETCEVVPASHAVATAS